MAGHDVAVLGHVAAAVDLCLHNDLLHDVDLARQTRVASVLLLVLVELV